MEFTSSRLKIARQRRGLTKRELAELVGAFKLKQVAQHDAGVIAQTVIARARVASAPPAVAAPAPRRDVPTLTQPVTPTATAQPDPATPARTEPQAAAAKDDDWETF